MSVIVTQLAATDLRITTGTSTATVAIVKTNYLGPGGTGGRTIGGQPGQIMGHWRAAFVRLPTNISGNVPYVLLGAGVSNDGNFTGGSDSTLRVYGTGAGASLSRKITARYAPTSVATTLTDYTDASALDNLGTGKGWLVIEGISNVSTQTGVTDWRQWAAVCKADDGTPSSHVVTATQVTSTWITSVTGRLLQQVFSAAPGSGSARTPVGVALEHVALVSGDFPWDTVNNRPHHDAVAALAGVGSNPYLTYSDLISAQNSGTLAYPNLDAGRGNLDFYWTLVSTSTAARTSIGQMTSATSSTVGLITTATLSLTPGSTLTNLLSGLGTGDLIAPQHWYGAAPVINDPFIRFIGGHGQRAYTITGTYSTGTTSLQRRWLSGGSFIPGFDWANVTTFNVNNTWSTTDTLPEGGPYTLEVRDPVNTDRIASSNGWIVGTVILTHGQSGMELSFSASGGNPGTNTLGITIANNVVGKYVKLSNQIGFNTVNVGSLVTGTTYAISALSTGGAATDFTLIGAANNNTGTIFVAANSGAGNGTGQAMVYTQPSLNNIDLIANTAQTNLGHGTVLFFNEWNTWNPGRPLLVCNMAINGTSMINWANNVPVEGNYFNWNFMGTEGQSSTATSGNSSGVVETYAAALGRYVDLHMIMWTPGMSGISTGTGSRALYVQGIDDRFSESPNAPWVVMPPWRGHRDPPDGGAIVSKRQEHLDFVTELGDRGILGPYWPDIVSDSTGSAHSAFNRALSDPSTSLPVSDGNHVGQARLGRSQGRVVSWVFNRTIKAHGPRLLEAWYTDNSRTSIQVELGRSVRIVGTGTNTNNQFWISLNSGTTWTQTGFTFSLSTDSTRAILSTSTQFPASGVRVDYARLWPFGPIENPSELDTEVKLLNSILYDDQTHRGLNPPVGNPLQGTNREGVNVAGIPVESRGAPKLVATEKWTGTRTVTLRMMAADGVTVLREKTFTITAS